MSLAESPESTESVRLDRCRLEAMISQDAGSVQRMLGQVERQTGARLCLQCRLRQGQQLKRDPTVRISGPPEAVSSARVILITGFSRRFSRLSLRIDIPHCEHAQLIGRGGSLQQSIKTSTGTDIHFPDSNKSNRGGQDSAKSNRVALNGLAGWQPAGIEEARRLIRLRQPLAFHIQLPAPKRPPQHLITIANNRGVQLQLGRLSGSSCWSVRAVADSADAVVHVVDAAAAAAGWPALVSSELRVEPRHLQQLRDRLSELVGPGNLDAAVAEKFGLQAFWLRDDGEATVWETGGARQSLALREVFISCLPVSLGFDIPLHIFPVEEAWIDSLTDRCADGVSIDSLIIKRGQQDATGSGSIRSVVMRTYERNAGAMYRLFCSIFSIPWPHQDIQSQMFLPQLSQQQQAVSTSSRIKQQSSPLKLQRRQQLQQDRPDNQFPPPIMHPKQQQQQMRELRKELLLSPTTSAGSSSASSTVSQSSLPQSPPSKQLLLATILPPVEKQQQKQLWQQEPQQQQRQSYRQKTEGKQLQARRQQASESLAPGAEYTRRRLAAMSQIATGVRGSTARFPDAAWSGQFFSRSCMQPRVYAATAETKALPAAAEAEPAAVVPGFSHSFCDGQLRPMRPIDQVTLSGSWEGEDQLVRILTDNRLADCVEIMQQQEIDLPTFLTLSDEDLQALGLSFSVRQRVRHLIRSLPGR